MDSEWWQAALSVFLLSILVGSVVAGGNFLGLAAPASGGAWATADDANPGSVGNQVARTVAGPRTVKSPYGRATVRYDRHGVPHITAENERALYFAVGYVQARDRLFQMDLQRRLMAGNLSAAFGERALESDRFHRKMGFAEAANASWRAIRDSEAGANVRAYTAGVNRYIDRRPLPMEFRLNDYRPTEWRPRDTLLVGKLISWSLSGDFRDLRQRTVARRLPEATALYPRRLDHESSIVGRARVDNASGVPVASPAVPRRTADLDGDVRALYESLSRHEAPAGLGSNSWIVSGRHTASGEPILANDPHLSLTVPPVWYEMHLRAGNTDVRGVAFPGVPFVVIGRNSDVAWGFTNVDADQTDLYTYRTPGEDTYVYRGEVRQVREHTETIPVKGGEDARVTVRRTVHGPLLEREGAEVAVAWVGLTATRESEAIYRLSRASNLADVREAMRSFDSPTQNFVAIDRDGGTYFRITGEYPIRRVDGEAVPGDRVFNGSAGHGEWRGFEPYGRSSWEGFVPYGEVPELRNPGYVATANQRTMDDPPFYIATSTRYADPYRGARIYDLLERRVDSGEPVTREYVRRIQRDTYSKAAEQFVPQILDARGAMDAETRAAADRLAEWDYRMTADSRAALVFALWRERYRNATFGDEYRAAGLDSSYFPHYWTLGRLPADSEWFDDERTPEIETREDIVARTLRRALREAEREGYGTYGDYNRLRLEHQFPLAFLDYPTRPMDGSAFTVYNFRVARDTQAGSSWRMIAAGDRSLGIIPGGQSGNYFSPHYSDQLEAWAEGGYKPLTLEDDGRKVIVFREESG